jgi:hypothetical protein
VWNNSNVKKRILIIFTIIYILSSGGSGVFAFSTNDDYLWIEFGSGKKEKDGSISFPFQIHYGRFPTEKKDIGALEDIRAFYTLNEDTNEDALYYPVEIKKNLKGYSLNIRSCEANRYTLHVEANMKQNQGIHRYYAKTSFVLFGHGPAEGNRSLPVPSVSIDRTLEICVSPKFHYWPQTGIPVKISPVFYGQQIIEEKISLFDENMPLVQIKTDEKGKVVYQPPEDKILNRKSDTGFKQTVMVVEMTEGERKYTSSYTLLLHRSRYNNYRFLTGIIIFCSTIFVVSLFVIMKRKRSNL